MLVFFLKKRSRLGFDESDEEEILDKQSVVLACSASHMVEDARVGPSELMDSGAQGELSVAEVPEEGVNALPEVDREAETSGEQSLTIKVPSRKEVGR